MPKKIISLILIILTICSMSVGVSAYEPSGFSVSAKNAMLICLEVTPDNDEIIFEKGADERVYPASITKIMTATLMLESERYNPEAKVAMTEEVLKLISGTGSSVSNLKVGEEITQLDLLYMVLMSSFGDCTLLAAITYADTVENFVAKMNAKAQELGLENTHYENPVGLHHEENYTTPRDTYILTKYALQNETFKTVCESHRYTVPATNMSNYTRTLTTTNMLQDNTTNYYYPYAKGVKTGYTDEAGRCLVSTASYNGYKYMCLVFGCPPNAREHFADSRNLYRWAFNNFKYKQVADSDNPICEIGVDLSLNTDFVSLYVENGFRSVLPKDADDSTISIVPHPTDKKVDAPIKKGQVLGTADIIYAEQVLGTVNLVSHEDVEKSNLLALLRAVKKFFTSSYMKIVYALIGIAVLVFIISIIKLNAGRKKSKRKVKYVPYRENRKH